MCARVRVYMFAGARLCVHAYVRMYECVRACVRVCVCVCVRACLRACVYVCVDERRATGLLFLLGHG